jgi:hypothetical protein
MGYDMWQLDASFKIPGSKIGTCLEALVDLARSQLGYRREDDSPADEPEALAEVMDCWDWIPKFDQSGSVSSIRFYGEKIGQDFSMFEAIAPYVERGSYIQMIGEDFAIWRWYFNGAECIEEAPEIVFPAHE